MMNVVILQPSYIPWRGVFDQIRRADLYIFYDDVQYDKHGWRNRNQIKTGQGKQWLTIPVHSAGATQGLLIKDAKIDWSKPWAKNHWKALAFAYAKAPYFQRYASFLEPFYQRSDPLLADFTIDLTIALARAMGITQTRFMRSSAIPGISGEKTDRLIQILSSVGAKNYISGPSARDYIEADKFEQAAITLEYMRYNYPEYPQLYSPYDPYVSILDLLFMVGEQALSYLSRPQENKP
ncbi:MAG: WbqC family protein [Anaerolineales bacterium]|jgi:hypothetical protein|nr:WbqC family protein [Anaerolineales bacterium]